mmetsp:Transcript_17615/g.52756  ORF Transcript_17615/g.52756 Transcript_17615/m.52756 type:complete len:321 (-) Transcript_17615:17-979(-)
MWTLRSPRSYRLPGCGSQACGTRCFVDPLTVTLLLSVVGLQAQTSGSVRTPEQFMRCCRLVIECCQQQPGRCPAQNVRLLKLQPHHNASLLLGVFFLNTQCCEQPRWSAPQLVRRHHHHHHHGRSRSNNNVRSSPAFELALDSHPLGRCKRVVSSDARTWGIVALHVQTRPPLGRTFFRQVSGTASSASGGLGQESLVVWRSACERHTDERCAAQSFHCSVRLLSLVAALCHLGRSVWYAVGKHSFALIPGGRHTEQHRRLGDVSSLLPSRACVGSILCSTVARRGSLRHPVVGSSPRGGHLMSFFFYIYFVLSLSLSLL